MLKAAQDPLVREIISRFLISSFSTTGDYNARENWILALEKVEAVDEKLLDRMAWMAYRNGDLKKAQELTSKSNSDSVIRLWLLSRFDIRKGERDNAFKHLKAMTEKIKASDYYVFPLNEDHGYLNENEDFQKFSYGELALLQLEKGQFNQSLKLFFDSQYYEDAAYLAERILTADELKKFIDDNRDHLAQNKDDFLSLKLLLARKLTREGKWETALPYFTEERQKKVKELFESIKLGQDLKIAQEIRADHLWNAAVIVREWGMSLLGTELFPDAAIYEGSFEISRMDKSRLELFKNGEIPLSESERERIKIPPASNLKRYHYKYIASDLAWKAVKLMKRNDVKAARRLIIAGNWLKSRDPKAADRFYKELVNKCGQTDLGREADKLRWFPKLNEEKEN